MPEIVVVIVITLIPVIYVVATYNKLISLKNHIRDAWSNIDTELNRRYDLIPNLVSTVKGYARHEQEILEKLTRLRSQCMANTGSIANQAADETRLVDTLKRVIAVTENYPDLKADQHFLSLQRELVNTEDRIQAARRFFNGNVRDYRNARETFPSTLIASAFGFESLDFFEVEAAVRTVPKV